MKAYLDIIILKTVLRGLNTHFLLNIELQFVQLHFGSSKV